jgi:hypothetical protein
MNFWRPILSLLLVAGIAFAGVAHAQARPVWGVLCPTGTAQVVLGSDHGHTDTDPVN